MIWFYQKREKVAPEEIFKVEDFGELLFAVCIVFEFSLLFKSVCKFSELLLTTWKLSELNSSHCVKFDDGT